MPFSGPTRAHLGSTVGTRECTCAFQRAGCTRCGAHLSPRPSSSVLVGGRSSSSLPLQRGPLSLSPSLVCSHNSHSLLPAYNTSSGLRFLGRARREAQLAAPPGFFASCRRAFRVAGLFPSFHALLRSLRCSVCLSRRWAQQVESLLNRGLIWFLLAHFLVCLHGICATRSNRPTSSFARTGDLARHEATVVGEGSQSTHTVES